MVPWVRVPPLEGSLVRLEPLAMIHAPDLAEAAARDRASFAFTLVPRPEQIDQYLSAQFDRMARGLVPFAQIRRADGRAVGCTAYWEPRFWPGREGIALRAVEIGFTWLGSSAQGVGINADAKLLLLRHAIDPLDVERVDFKTDSRNERSRLALEALGATFEGAFGLTRRGELAFLARRVGVFGTACWRS